MSSALDGPVDDLIDAVAPVLAGLAPNADPAVLRRDVALEAANLVAAVIDADGRHTDDELWAYSATFGARLGTPLGGATPEQLRQQGMLAGRADWLGQPSELFSLLVAADGRNGTRHAWAYYERAMHLAYTVASVDLVSSAEELAGIERLRGTLLGAMRSGGVRPVATPTPEAPSPSEDGEPGAGDPPPRPLEELLAELDALVGLVEVKAEVNLVTDLLAVGRLRRERGLPTVEGSRHLVFAGNPGTGKTTVARLVAQIYRTLGVVSRGHLVETDRSGMVAGFVGQTAARTREVIETALGGVLLIDEAQALARGSESDFGKEAIDTLVKMMEDHRDDLVVIAAGYTDEMQVFLDANPGLRSRFGRTIVFADYTDHELVAIFSSLGERHRYHPDDAALERVRAWLADQPRTKAFGNARAVRNLFEASVTRHASRVMRLEDPSEQDLVTLTADDIAW